MIDAADPAWLEYDAAAEWCAKRGIKGDTGDALPDALSATCYWIINDDPEAFAEHVKATAYALAMETVDENPTD